MCIRDRSGSGPLVAEAATCDRLLNKIPALLEDSNGDIRREACWLVSNIFAGEVEEIEAVIKTSIVPKMMDMLSQDSYDIRKEILLALENFAQNGSYSQVLQATTDWAILEKVLDVISLEDDNLTLTALSIIELVLKQGDSRPPDRDLVENPFIKVLRLYNGAEQLEQLQFHPNEQVYTLVYRLINSHFEAVDRRIDEEEENLS
eukprot:TRINITY_DN1160_c0_g5_i1.p1 TRINITY_DN1160_c0_g5~~TRINITY_DN1160_c0_g5_i1.p1  ORF type:complete len:230 (+),score=50.96 TRINITY_DN1160_c0_g5_i1:80-691(+)